MSCHLLPFPRSSPPSLWICALFLFAASAVTAQEDILKQCQTAAGSKLDTAVQLCSSAIQNGKLSPDDLLQAYLSRGSAYGEKKEYGKAFADFQQALRLQPKSAPAYYAMGQLDMAQSKIPEAIQHYSDAIRANPKFVPAISDRGIAYLKAGNTDRALQDFAQAIRVGPQFIPAYMNRAGVYMQRNDVQPALRDYDQVLQISPTYLPGIVARSSARAAVKQYDEAISDLDDAIRLQSANPALWTRQGDLYAEKGDFGHAIRDLNTALRLQPGSDTILAARGFIEVYLKDYGSAERDLTSAISAQKDDPYPALWLYLAQRKAGKSGLEDLRKNSAALRLNDWPGPVIKLYLGEIKSDALLAAANNTDSAKSASQHCEAYFYLGEEALLSGKADDAVKLFQQSVATGLSAYVEYRGAVVELAALKAAHN